MRNRALYRGWLAPTCALVAIVLSGCGDGGSDADADVDADEDTDTDLDADDGGDGDGDADADLDEDPDEDADLTGCAATLVEETTFALAPDDPDVQIHPSAIMVDDSIWVAFDLPETGSSFFDVFAMRLGCDGTILTPTFRVNTTTEPNDVDPTLALLSTGEVLVVWQSDTGAPEGNMQVFYRTFGPDGTPAMAEDRRLATTFQGRPVTGSSLMPSAVALPEGGFAIAATRGLPTMTSFQVFVQRLSNATTLDGEAINGFLDNEEGQLVPAVAAEPDGSLHLAWASRVGPTGEIEQVVYKPVDDGTSEPEVVAPDDTPTWAPALAIDPVEGERRYLAFHGGSGSDPDIVLTDVGRPSGSRPLVRFGAGDRIDHTPSIALAPDGGAVAWLRIISGLRNEVVIEGFRAEDGALIGNGEIVIGTTESAGAYQLALVHVVDDVYFVAWAEGLSPAYRIFGRMVRVP